MNNVNPIPTGGADYAHHITTYPPPPFPEDFRPSAGSDVEDE